MTAPFIGVCGYCREEGVVTSLDYIPPKDKNEFSVWVTICLTCVKEIVTELEAYDNELNYGERPNELPPRPYDPILSPRPVDNIVPVRPA